MRAARSTPGCPGGGREGTTRRGSGAAGPRGSWTAVSSAPTSASETQAYDFSGTCIPLVLPKWRFQRAGSGFNINLLTALTFYSQRDNISDNNNLCCCLGWRSVRSRTYLDRWERSENHLPECELCPGVKEDLSTMLEMHSTSKP